MTQFEGFEYLASSLAGHSGGTAPGSHRLPRIVLGKSCTLAVMAVYLSCWRLRLDKLMRVIIIKVILKGC